MLITLMGTAIFCFLIGLYGMSHYSSDSYSEGQQSITAATLTGSMICDSFEYVCTNLDTAKCTCVYDTVTQTISGDGCELKNHCHFDGTVATAAYLDIGMVLVMLIGLFMLGKLQNSIVEEADEAEQTAQDYSIMVDDPDADATNPDEWQAFFSQFGHVSYVTCAINNGELIQKLAERRVTALKIAYETALPSERASMFDPSENDSAFEALSDWKKKLIGYGLSSDVTVERRKIQQLDEEIAALAKKEYECVKVFVVFETEEAQRSCLREMTVGVIPAMLEAAAHIPEHQRFRGTNVLSINEAPEPTDIIWVNLETSIQHRVIEQTCTLSASFFIVTICGVIIYFVSGVNAAAAAMFISISNGMLPAILKQINNTEEHLTQGHKQASLLLKLVFARWMTTGFIVWGIRDFTETLKAVFLSKVSAVLFADAFTTPVLRFMDLGSRYSHNFAAKKASTQEKMNSMFQGTPWFLAERYTDMTKTLFVSTFFGVLLPSGYLVSMLAFLCCYWVDKYCLFRLWKQPPAIDASLTVASRLQIAVILIVHCVIACQVFAGFPFDNVTGCEVEAQAAATMECSTCLVSKENGRVDVTSTETRGDSPFSVGLVGFCDQSQIGDFINVGTKDFMTDSQKGVVDAYSIVNIFLMVIVCVGYFGRTAAYSLYSLIYGSYVPVGEANEDEFSFVPGIQTYVPILTDDSLPLPLICCDLEQFDNEHISFTSDYSKVDITKDAPIVNSGADIRKIFSVCKQYPSPKLMEKQSA